MNNSALRTRLDSKIQAIAEAEFEARKEEAAETALVPINSDYVALTNNAIAIIKENLKDQPITFQLFDLVKSPSGGSTVFSVPGLSGDEPAKELVGIILDYTTPRAYWDSPEPVEGTPPNCFSPDSVISSDGKACARCPFNTFGSSQKAEESNAKACKESVVMFLLRPDNIMPIVVRVPVTSKILFQRYMTRLIGKMTPLSSVVTRITLEKATSKGGKPYALYKFEVVSTLTPDEAAAAKEFGKQLTEMLKAAEMETVLQQAG